MIIILMRLSVSVLLWLHVHVHALSLTEVLSVLEGSGLFRPEALAILKNEAKELTTDNSKTNNY